jgi:hypothetical protein
MRRVDEQDELTAQVLGAYGLKPWDAGLAPVPLRVRIWRAVTFARRRGQVIDWRSYNAAEAEARAAEAAFIAALPGRAQEIADHFSAGLPDGLRFEWVTDGE